MDLDRRLGRLVRCTATIVLAAVVAMGCGDEDDEEPAAPEFGYSGSTGPSAWGELDPSYRACSEGRSQSPVDLAGARVAAASRLRFAYEPAALEVENNGHSLEAAYPPGSRVEVGGESYELRQFHYHAPSEHTVGGRSSPMELHLVHESAAGETLVLGVLVGEGSANPAASRLVQALPEQEAETLPVPGEVNAIDLLPRRPESAGQWVYEGSFTTPPCTEGVSWRVFSEPIELSAEQIAAYTGVYEGNNRPVQPLNGRPLAITR